MKKFFLTLLISSLVSFGFALPGGYGKVTLGMGVDEVKQALKSDSQFGYRGDRDVSLAPSDKQYLIETDGSYAVGSFLEECWFQFSEDKLYTITVNLNQNKIDYYSVFTQLCKKYGDPQELSPVKSKWDDGNVIMSLEKPLTLKYIDKKAHEKKLNQSDIKKSTAEYSRDRFLEGL